MRVSKPPFLGWEVRAFSRSLVSRISGAALSRAARSLGAVTRRGGFPGGCFGGKIMKMVGYQRPTHLHPYHKRVAYEFGGGAVCKGKNVEILKYCEEHFGETAKERTDQGRGRRRIDRTRGSRAPPTSAPIRREQKPHNDRCRPMRSRTGGPAGCAIRTPNHRRTAENIGHKKIHAAKLRTERSGGNIANDVRASCVREGRTNETWNPHIIVNNI